MFSGFALCSIFAKPNTAFALCSALKLSFMCSNYSLPFCLLHYQVMDIYFSISKVFWWILYTGCATFSKILIVQGFYVHRPVDNLTFVSFHRNVHKGDMKLVQNALFLFGIFILNQESSLKFPRKWQNSNLRTSKMWLETVLSKQ